MSTPFSIPLTDIDMHEEDVQAVLDCLQEGWLTMGPRTQAFEAAFGDWVGADHSVAVGSGTAALHLALLAAGVGPGDEVIVPAFTFVATAAAPRYCGAEVMLADVRSPLEPTLDVLDVASRISPRTKAVVAVHFAGYAADMVALRGLCADHGLVLIEDCAQAVGARCADGLQVGLAGDAGCFSFFSKKQLCVGEGGMVTTRDEALAAKVRSLRSHAMTSVTWDRHRGHAESYDIVDIGFNYRLDEPRAALGLSRLPRLTADLASRRATVRAYRERLAGVPQVEFPWTDEDVERASHFACLVLFPDRGTRDAVRDRLQADGIQTTWYPSLTEFTEYESHGRRPVTEEAAGRHLALPLSSTTTIEQVDFVVERVRAALG
ncbi:MAG: DegT/DnrJ/EryC1/StrS family aminotransferase [Solirubrobacteraceae bacterium]|nr:DegT/DnrJ/EryC1/StrS family aminotransferase [Solirubrobacteraceae bacterium]